MRAELSLCTRPLPLPRPAGDSGWASPVRCCGRQRPGPGGPERLPRTERPERPGLPRTDRHLSPGSAAPAPPPSPPGPVPSTSLKPSGVAVSLTERLRRQREHSPGARRGAVPSPARRGRPARLRWRREEPRPPPARETSAQPPPHGSRWLPLPGRARAL